MEELSLALLQLLAALLSVGIGFVINFLKKKIGNEKIKGIKEQLEAKKELALLAVKFVEQAFNHLDSETKYNEAAKWLSNRAKDVGLTITDAEVKGLIEGALRDIKDQLGENWGTTKK